MTAWESTKKWVDENRVVSGAVAGLAAGTVVPGVGNVVGALVGAGVGWWSAKEKAKREISDANQNSDNNVV